VTRGRKEQIVPSPPFARLARQTGRIDAEPLRSGRIAGHAAWIWAVAFVAIHIYWYLGGRIGHPNPLPDASLDAFNVVVAALFVAGVVVPLASVSDWGRAIPRRLLLAALWSGSAILLLRSGAGMVDEVLRVTRLSPTGLTGLTREQVTGSAHPSANILWSGRAIDAFFLLGGVLFGLAAHAYQRPPHPGVADRTGHTVKRAPSARS
jgi:hypothetical protein